MINLALLFPAPRIPEAPVITPVILFMLDKVIATGTFTFGGIRASHDYLCHFLNLCDHLGPPRSTRCPESPCRASKYPVYQGQQIHVGYSQICFSGQENTVRRLR